MFDTCKIKLGMIVFIIILFIRKNNKYENCKVPYNTIIEHDVQHYLQWGFYGQIHLV